MRSIASLGLLFSATLALSGCFLSKSAQSAYHESFRKSFKASFLDSCGKSSGGMVKECACVEDQIEKTHSDDELVKLATDQAGTQKAFTDAAAACGLKMH